MRAGARGPPIDLRYGREIDHRLGWQAAPEVVSYLEELYLSVAEVLPEDGQEEVVLVEEPVRAGLLEDEATSEDAGPILSHD